MMYRVTMRNSWFARCAFFVGMLSPFLLSSMPTHYASLVMDAKSRRVLHQIGAKQTIYPASLTKIMTLYLVFEALQRGKLKLEQPLRVSRKAASQVPTRLGLKTGQTIKVRQAILSLVCRSANDSAVVLAEAVSGSERAFAQRMNHKACMLGMRHTRFRNASGLFHPGQTTTASDMALLGMGLINRFPREYACYFRQPGFHYAGRRYRTTNKLVGRVRGVDGMKTGYIQRSGFNLVTSAKRGNRRLMAVVIGGKTARWRDAHMASLIEQGFAASPARPVLRPAVYRKKAVKRVLQRHMAPRRVLRRRSPSSSVRLIRSHTGRVVPQIRKAAVGARRVVRDSSPPRTPAQRRALVQARLMQVRRRSTPKGRAAIGLAV
jgi:D-alanyl-D-alanine carboxypeptidase